MVQKGFKKKKKMMAYQTPSIPGIHIYIIKYMEMRNYIKVSDPNFVRRISFDMIFLLLLVEL